MHPISSKTKFVIAGAATAFVGLAVIFGWLFDWVVIRSVFLGGATMKLNTAACFVLLGLALIFIQYPKLKIGYVVCSIAVLVIALLSLSEYLFNWAAGMDEAFVKDTASQTAGIAHPGLMSPLTATCFCLIALALPGMRSAKRSALLTLQYALHLATLIAAIALFGYLFHAPSFSRFSFFTSIAVHTALLIFLFSITASLLHPTLGITGLFTGRLTGNVMFRRLFLLFTALLIGIGFLTIQSVANGLLEYRFAIILSSLIAIIVFLLLISITAAKLNQTDQRRQEAENSLQRLNTELEEKVAQRNRQLHEANEKLHRQNQTLEEANVELTSFTHIASHDLKEPLRKIRMYISAIENENIDAFALRTKDYFNRIVDASERMGALIDDLLDFSKINTDSNALKPVDLNELLGDVRSELAEVIAEKSAVIQSDHLPMVQGVSFQLHQLFTNLLSNAIKYSKDSLAPSITITNGLVQEEILHQAFPAAKGSYHRICFADNGIGFSPEYRYKVFELFQRLHSRTAYSGTGVGLAICKKVVDHHHGYITAEGEPDVGAKFTVYLPC